MSELSEYLDQEKRDGISQESGVFNLNPAQAMQKLAQFALPEPGLWVVKLVQAAVAAGSDEVRIKFLRQKVIMAFKNSRQWDAEEILQMLLSGQIPKERELKHLQTGLLAATEGLTQDIAWSCGNTRVFVDDNGPRVIQAEASEDFQLVVTRAKKAKVKPSTFGSPIRYLFRKTAHEYKALVDRCRVCPIPVRVDGYQLPTHYHCHIWQLPTKPNFNGENPNGRGLLFAQLPLPGYSQRAILPFPICPQPLVERSQERNQFSALFCLPETPVRGLVCLYSILQRESRVCFVLDGAMVEEIKLFRNSDQKPALKELQEILNNGKDDFVLDYYFALEPDDLDLSHFKVRDVDLQELVLPSLSALEELFREALVNCQKPWQFENLLKPPDWLSPNASFGDLLGTALIAPFILPLMMYYGAKTVSRPLAKLTKPILDRQRGTRLRNRLEEIVVDLNLALPGGSQKPEEGTHSEPL